MTPFAGGEIIAAKSTFTVVASQAALCRAGSMMVERLRRCDLPALRQPRSHLMTFVAGNPVVFGVRETDAKRRRGLRRARVAAWLMADAAGRNIATAGLRPRGMTGVTGYVRVKAGRD